MTGDVQPLLSGRWTRLEPLGARHMEALSSLLVHDDMADEWPLRGERLSPEELEGRLWAMSNLQYAAISRRDDSVVGLVQAIDEDPQHATVGVSFLLRPDVWNSGWPLEAVIIFIGVLFDWAGFRKVYCRMADSSFNRVSRALGRGVTEEACFRRHLKRGTEYEDLHVAAMYAEDWDSAIIDRVLRGPQRGRTA